MPVDALLIAGPTASGKSAVALAVAEALDGALINADSMQVYREARILTARPNEAAIARAPHFLYGHASVYEPHSVARYRNDAAEALLQTRTAAKVPIFVGGTGLYFHALIAGLAEVPEIPEAVRMQVRDRREAIGAQPFYEELMARDPGAATRLRVTDTQRVLRATEVLEATGMPLARWQEKPGAVPLAGLRLARFVLSPPRDDLYRRIERRFDRMLAEGALEEARSLKGLDPALPSAKILGLRQLWAVLDGALTPNQATAGAKTATRQYAKRQNTWFRHRMGDWTWVEATETREIVARMLEHLQTTT